ncbi:MAG: glycoside hydrolase family 28 protein, partial [Phocaeicola sp.]
MKRINLLTGALGSMLLLGCQEKSTTIQLPYIPTIEEVGAHALPDSMAPITQLPFEMPQLQRPSFPADTLHLLACGIKADQQIATVTNQAIQELSAKGGGVVVIPAGQWKSNRIEIKSNINLHFAEGAVVEFSGVAEGYLPAVFTRHEGIDIMGPAAFVYAHKATNIAITGKGKIIGPPMEAEIRQRPNGPSVVEKDIPVDLPIEKRIYDGMNGRTFYRPKSISPIECTNVLIEGVTLERSAQWNIAPVYCENVIIRGVTVHSVEVPSGDGIDIESCKNVLIEYTTLNCGDDCFTLKAGRAEDGLRVGKPT